MSQSNRLHLFRTPTGEQKPTVREGDGVCVCIRCVINHNNRDSGTHFHFRERGWIVESFHHYPTIRQPLWMKHTEALTDKCQQNLSSAYQTSDDKCSIALSLPLHINLLTHYSTLKFSSLIHTWNLIWHYVIKFSKLLPFSCSHSLAACCSQTAVSSTNQKWNHAGTVSACWTETSVRQNADH